MCEIYSKLAIETPTRRRLTLKFSDFNFFFFFFNFLCFLKFCRKCMGMSLAIQIFHSWKKNNIFLFFLRFCNGQQFINVQNCNLIIKLIKRQSCHHIETTHLTCSKNLLTGFYMMTTLAFNELRHYELSIKWYEKLVFKHLIFNGCMSTHQSS